jgi:two-component sensor histidine kinase
MTGVEHRLDLSPRPASAAEARRFVARALDGVSAQAREIGVLLTSELVTNALLYAQGRITVRVVPGSAGGAVRVIVHDGNSQPVEPRRVGADATSGRGLALVEQLSTSWGVDLVEDDGKEVWFEVSRA